MCTVEIVDDYTMETVDTVVLPAVPQREDHILYRTFRKNPSLTGPIYDIVYSVQKVKYLIEEDWNRQHDVRIILLCSEISRELIKQ